MIRFIKFAELPVDDQTRAVAFYTEKLGFKVVQDRPYMTGWRWIELKIPGADTHILLTRRETAAAPDAPRLVLIADDLDATCRELKHKGVAFTKDPAAAPWEPGLVFAQFRDSEGNGIVIMSMAIRTTSILT